MHAELKSFLETDFASYLHLGDLDMESLLLLCSDPDVERECPKGSTFGVGSSAPTPVSFLRGGGGYVGHPGTEFSPGSWSDPGMLLCVVVAV
ncbi:unnamed protein product [Lactuca virosa]|uniref:Uncharacterized protein n=1 Tax=Lactuca virosa TaxID=75947 RepID=A0AAU9PPJ7_9ASTR|nr:unnamed protein product [Lactuca virosa]